MLNIYTAALEEYANTVSREILAYYCHKLGRPSGHTNSHTSEVGWRQAGWACQASADMDMELFVKTLHNFMQGLTAAVLLPVTHPRERQPMLRDPKYSLVFLPSGDLRKAEFPMLYLGLMELGKGDRPLPLMCCRTLCNLSGNLP